MRERTWPELPDDLESRRPRRSFWDAVDSQLSFYAGPSGCDCTEWHVGDHCTYWLHVRDKGSHCLAAKSDGDRCWKQCMDGTPFCEFHLGRAWEAMALAATDAQKKQILRRLEMDGHWAAQRYYGRDSVLHYETGLSDDVKIAAARLPEQVYFFAAGDVVKVGRSIDPQKRVKTLGGTLAPEGIDVRSGELLGTIPGGARAESQLHQQFRQYRVIGEWFSLPPVREAIELLLAEHGSSAA